MAELPSADTEPPGATPSIGDFDSGNDDSSSSDTGSDSDAGGDDSSTAPLPSDDGIQGPEDREAGVGTPETEAEQASSGSSSDRTVVFEDEATNQQGQAVPGDVKGVVEDPGLQDDVQGFAAQRTRGEQRFEREQQLAETGRADLSTPSGPARVSPEDSTPQRLQRKFDIGAIDGTSRTNRGRTSRTNLRGFIPAESRTRSTGFDGIRNVQGNKIRNELRASKSGIDTLDVRKQQAGSGFTSNLFGTAEGLRETAQGTAEIVLNPLQTAGAVGQSFVNAIENPSQAITSIRESGKRIGRTIERPGGAGLVTGSIIGDTALGLGAGRAAQFGARQARRAAARFNPKFRGVETAESGAQKIDIDSLTERDDVNQIELVQPGGASNVDADQAAAEGFGKEAREGAFTKDITEQFQDAERLAEQDSITITSAQSDLTNTGLAKFFKGQDTELRSPDTVEEAREIAETGQPLDALFFSSPPTRSGNPVARKSRLGTQDTKGLSGIGLPKREKPQILIDEDADLKNIFDDDEIGDLARRAADGDEQAARELVQSDRFKELQFEQDDAFTPIGFDSPESELTTNAPLLRDEGRIGLSDVDGEVVDIRRVSTVDPDNPSGVSDDVAEALDEAETPGDVEDITKSSDELISSKPDTESRFSPAKASGEATGLASTQFASVDTDSSVPETTRPDASLPSGISDDTARVASDVFPDSDQTSSSPSQPSAPTVQSAVSGSSPGEPSSPSVPSSPSQPSDSNGPGSGLSTGGSSAGGGSSSGGGSSGGSSGGGSSGSGGGSGGTPGGGRRRRRDDDDRRPDDVDVQIGRRGNEVFKKFEDLPFNEAKKILRRGVEGTAAASGKLVDEQGNPVEAPGLRSQFDKRENGFFVEAPSNRIQSRGEKQDITFEGLEEQASQARRGRSNVFTEQSVPGLEQRQTRGVGFDELQGQKRSNGLGRGPFFDAEDDNADNSVDLPDVEDVL